MELVNVREIFKNTIRYENQQRNIWDILMYGEVPHRARVLTVRDL